jgi:hypothetical protein
MRIDVWFSCGAASACAARLAIDKYGKDRTRVIYCDVASAEHPDNIRFMSDVEQWLGVFTVQVRSKSYVSVDDVFERTRYMSGIAGARCTTELKKIPRFDFQGADDIHVFGYTKGEEARVKRFEENNPELSVDWVLIDAGMTKQDCFRMLKKAKIALPAMYALGYKNNNCIGCVKATSPGYWNKIRHDFPETFARRARQSREIGCKLARYRGRRVFLDELPTSAQGEMEFISCGPECSSIQKQEAT